MHAIRDKKTAPIALVEQKFMGCKVPLQAQASMQCAALSRVCRSGSLLLQRSPSNPARLGFCLLKGHQSNSGSAKATHLRRFSFTPLETPYGQLKLEVDYAPAAAVTFLEQSSRPQQQAEIIPDYVRGAQPADKQRLAQNALRGGLTASLQGTQRQSSLLNPASTGLCSCFHHCLPRSS